MFNVKVNTGPSSELISVANDVKPHLAITHTDDDTYLTELVKQVRAAVENYCGISIGSQTREWLYDFDGCEWTVPYGPVISFTSISKKTSTATYEAITVNDDYEFEGGKLKIFVAGRYKVVYTTGYTTLPHDLKRGMLEEIAYRYEHRGDKEIAGPISEGAKSYLIRFKDFNWD